MTPISPLLTAGAVLLAGAVLAVPATTSGPGPATAPTVGAAGRASSDGTVTAAAGPRRTVAVPSAGPRAGTPPDPARGPTTAQGAVPAGGFGWPLPGPPPVLRRFAPGPHAWSAGHRGVDLGAGAAAPVLAAGPGTVSFAGVIAGRGVVAVRHQGGLRTTYEPVTAEVAVGQVVAAGQRIGTLQGTPAHCGAGPCLHWGALVGDTYLDPLGLVAGPRRPPILLPLTGAPG